MPTTTSRFKSHRTRYSNDQQKPATTEDAEDTEPRVVSSVSSVVVSLCFAAPSFAQAPPRDPSRCAPQMLSAPFSADAGPSWNGWSPDGSNKRFQQAEQAGLAAAQVPNLKLKWAFGFPETISAYAQPAIAGGRVFVGAQNGTVYSLDAKTGCTYWTFRTQSAIRAAATVGSRRTAAGERGHVGVRRRSIGARLCARRADRRSAVGAQGRRSAGSARDRRTDALQDRLYVRSHPAKRRLRVIHVSRCCKFRGSLVALDINGNVVWKTFMLPENAKPLGKTSAGVQRWGPSGAGIWSAPTIDAARKVVTSRPATCTPSRSSRRATPSSRWISIRARSSGSRSGSKRMCGLSAVPRAVLLPPAPRSPATAPPVSPTSDLTTIWATRRCW